MTKANAFLCVIIGLNILSAANEEEPSKDFTTAEKAPHPDGGGIVNVNPTTSATDREIKENKYHAGSIQQRWSTTLQRIWDAISDKVTILQSKNTRKNKKSTRKQARWPELPTPYHVEKKNAIAVAMAPNGLHPRAFTLKSRDSDQIQEEGDDHDEMLWVECPDEFSATSPLHDDEPFVGIIFDIYHYDNEGGGIEKFVQSSNLEDETRAIPCGRSTNAVVRYQLLEPLQLELGSTVKHVVDYAYIPVLADQVEPVETYQNLSSAPTIATTDRGPGGQDAAVLGPRQQAPPMRFSHDWWQWWLPWWSWDGSQDHFSNYRMNKHAFAGGSHGEVWRGRRRCHNNDGSTRQDDDEAFCDDETVLIFKRLKVENGYRVLEAGLREIYFGRWLSVQVQDVAKMYTSYVDHFYREQNHALELWIVFESWGSSLRSFLYTGTLYGDYIVYQHSLLWMQLRMSVQGNQTSAPSSPGNNFCRQDCPNADTCQKKPPAPGVGKFLMREVLKQILQAAAYLHSNGIVHRDIKPSNIMCKTNIEWDDALVVIPDSPFVDCVLGDFSSAWDGFSDENLYTGGPSRLEQTDEYAPPEALFGTRYKSPWLLGPAFDSWSIGIVALELLLGTPNVFTVDQRTRAVLTHKMQRQGASNHEIERALYLAALSQFCIYNQKSSEWPLRQGDPLHRSVMVKQKCTIDDFQRALHARDPLGIGFDTSADTLLHLIWQLLAWDPKDRMTAAAALHHPFFNSQNVTVAGEHNALESQMLDPRMDMKLANEVEKFVCPKCGREFGDWHSCRLHARGRKHANFCTYEKESLPSCLNAHSMLPAHSNSGHCDIQGRRQVIEDFHTIELLSDQQFYGIFDGHSGNLASKYATSFLFRSMITRLNSLESIGSEDGKGSLWVDSVVNKTSKAFHDIHHGFLRALSKKFGGAIMDRSGTTATVMLVNSRGPEESIILANLGDSRAVLSTETNGTLDGIQLTKDHTAADPTERKSVEARGGFVRVHNGVARVNGTLVVTRSIGDAALAKYLSQTPDVFPFKKHELLQRCGDLRGGAQVPCFVILASDGLWDMVDNQEAVWMVAETVQLSSEQSSWRDNSSLQKAAEALVHEAYVRGSTDNIGVCVIALEE
ncbi:hypothetical protein ACA910_014241 [Epithemia clementina (nom. ined.)]